MRTSSTFARLVLAWFVLTLGVAIASPIVAPKAMALLCSDGGAMKFVMVDEDGQAVTPAQHTLDCALCLPAPLPPAHSSVQLAQPQPLAHALTPVEQARIAALVGAPLPPRGPPATS